MGLNKNWTDKEIDTLIDLWGTRTIPEIAKRMNRSINAIVVKSKRLDLGNQFDSGDMLNARRVSDMLGVDVHTVTDYWIKKCGLKAKNKIVRNEKKYTVILLDDLIEWLRVNPDKWDSRRLELYGLGVEYKWLKEKREQDKSIPQKRFKKWTAYEDMELIRLFKKGIAYFEISKLLDRSYSSVEHRIARIDVWGNGRFISESERRKIKADNVKKIEQLKHEQEIKKLLNVLIAIRNAEEWGEFWQRTMCMNWDDIKACTANEDDCDSCASFVRIKPQYCRKCGQSIIDRNYIKWRLCDKCSIQRKKETARKYMRNNTKENIFREPI